MVEVKQWYKVTEVGVIPEDWEVKRLGELVEVNRKITYGIVVPGPNIYNGVPMIRAQDYSKGWVDIDVIYRVSNKLDASYRRSKVIAGDILLTIVGSVGNVAKVPSILNGANLTQQTARISFNKELAISGFFINILQSKFGKKEILNFTKSGVQPSLNLSDVEKFLFPLPPLPEQQAIAQVLSDVDSLITSLEKLISKKRDVKTATMQQLLTGKKRLPSFGEGKGYKDTEIGRIPEDWEVRTIKDSYEICNNLRFPISEETRNSMLGIYPYYGPTKIQGYISEFRVEGEFALIGEDGDHFLKWKEMSMTQLAKGRFNVNNHAHIIKGTKNLTEWFFHYFRHKDITLYITRQGAGRYKLNKGSLEQILCALPSFEEQTVISQVLSDMDTEITQLESRLDKTKAIKQGMMQELLTGRTRLV